MAKKIPRKEREKQRHCEEVLRAAEMVFAEKGYDHARMSDIASAAEFSVGYLYRLWKSKKDLYIALLESKNIEFKSHIEARIAEAGDPLDKINSLIDAHFSYIEANRDFVKIYLNETSQAEIRIASIVSRRLMRNHTHYLRLVEEIFEEGVREGIFATISAHDLTVALKGMIFAFLRDRLNQSPTDDFRDKGSVMKQIFFYSILRRQAGATEEVRGK